ncbi:MAG TPA: hypothetical protein VLL76_03675 [Candidatus Omnitrophota bacterium]|nr:hypothetical protein [Candidatus Omnitrophota bacterium]
MDANTLRLIDLGLALAAAAASGATDAIEGADLVKRLVAENRDPTDAEWAALNATFKGLTKAIADA